MNDLNANVANMFISMGELLKNQGANRYRIQAYHRAAQTISTLQDSITNLAKQGELETLSGIGKDFSSKIQEFLATGTIQMYEQLKRPLPSHIQAWIQLPGLSEPLVNDLYFRLRIQTLKDLEDLVRSQLLRTRPGIPQSTEELIQAIHHLQQQPCLSSEAPSREGE